MSSVTYRQAWQELRRRNRNGNREILTWDPFRSWETNSRPESSCEYDLVSALEILYSHDDDDDAQQFLDRCLLIAARIRQENRLERSGSFPINRGTFLRGVAYAEALKDGTLNCNALLQASADYESWVASDPEHTWDSQYQAYYLNAVRLRLVAGDTQGACRLLNTRKKFKWHPDEHALLTAIARNGEVPLPLSHSALLASFDAYFDIVRNPHFKPDIYIDKEIASLELGAIRDRYFFSPEGVINWSRVIEAVSR